MTSLTRAIFAFFAVLAVFPSESGAVDYETLPKGVRLSQARFGVISGLDQTWLGNGKLYNLGETRSVTFDAATLARVNDRARSLVQALDYFGSNNLGEKIQLGTLHVQTKPEIQYFAPVFAYGLSKTWSVGVGVPIVHYRNQIRLSSGASNLDFYKQQFQGISKELDEALNIELVGEARKVLAEKGYRRLEDRDQTFVGDMQVAILHRLPDLRRWAFMHQMTLTLPTGPADDPDDLMALNSFGRTSIENMLIAGYTFNPRWQVLPYTSLLLPIPDTTVKRVPKNEDDNLPDSASKQRVLRVGAPTASLGYEVRWSLTRRWDIKGGHEASTKSSDHYEGQGRMDLLEKNSDSDVIRVKGGFTYSTVDDYKQGRAPIPGRVALEVSDTVRGRNIERQLRTELAAMLFF